MAVDPRIAQLGATVNDEVTSKAIRHATYLEQLKNQEVQQVIQFLGKEVVPDLLRQTQQRLAIIEARGFDTGPWTTQRLKELTVANQTLLESGMAQVSDRLEGSLTGVAINEAEWQVAAMDAAMPIAVDFTTPNVALLKSIVTDSPMNGAVLEDWFSGLAKSTGLDITRQIKIGIASGDTIDQLMARVKGADPDVFKNAFGNGSIAEMNRNARSVVRTAVTHTTVQAKEETYRANKDVIKGVQIVATLDNRTTEICMGMDGKVFPVDEGPRPPFHFNCRTTTVPVTKSWKEMGIPAKEVTAATRASMNGQVADDMTYGQWLKTQPKAVQQDVLGVQKATMFRAGSFDAQDFSTLTRGGEFNTLTLDQLREKEALADFAHRAEQLSQAETALEASALISELDSVRGDSARAYVRNKLRIIDPDWKEKYDRR